MSTPATLDSSDQADTAYDTGAGGHHIEPDDEAGFYNDRDGVYAGIPEADYHGQGEDPPPASRRASNSVLSKIVDKSPAHAKAALDDTGEPTSAQTFGTALHSAVLTPSLFDLKYGMKERCAGVKGDGDRCTYDGSYPWIVRGEEADSIQWFCGTHEPEPGDEVAAGEAVEKADVIVLSESKMEKIQAMRERIWAHEAASTLLYDLPGLEELTILWTHEATGVRCKSRVDRLFRHPKLGYVALDLKTARTAQPGTVPRTFGYDAAKYGYDRQGAFYLEALATAGIPVEHFIVLAIEKQPPYEAVPYLLTQQSMEQARGEFLRALREFKQCRQDGTWPGYTDQVVMLEMPPWRFDE